MGVMAKDTSATGLFEEDAKSVALGAFLALIAESRDAPILDGSSMLMQLFL